MGVARRQIMRLQASLSLPRLLAEYDERRVIAIFSAINGGISLLIIGIVAWAVDLPLLFPALGPTAFLFFSQPFEPSAAPRSVILGHGSAIVVGWLVWQATSAVAGPVSLQAANWGVFLSSAVTLSITCVLLVTLSCPHAPACGTALIVSVGAAEGYLSLVGMIAGVLLLTGQALLLGRLTNVNMPLWSQRPGQLTTDCTPPKR